MARARGWGFVLASTGIGSFVTSANLSTVNVAFPDLKASFEGESLASLGWVINAYTIAFAAICCRPVEADSTAAADVLRRVDVFALGRWHGGARRSRWSSVRRPGHGCAAIAPASLGLLLERVSR